MKTEGITHTFLYLLASATCTFADDPWQSPAVTDAGLPRMRHVGVVIDPSNLKYNPCNDAIFPSVIKTDQLQNPLGKFYMYYAPHDTPGGICMAYADKPEGPWKEYQPNPIIPATWASYHKTSHVSGPHAIWIEEEKKLFLYYHGPNDVTRYASSTDGIHFTYEGIAVDRSKFDNAGECSYARVHRQTIQGKDNRYIMLVMATQPSGGRKIFLAWSRDARQWETRREPFLASHNSNAYYGVTGGWLLPWNNKLYIIYHDYDHFTDLHACEVNPTFDKLSYLGLFHPYYASSTTNISEMSQCFIEDSGKLYMFSNIGARLKQAIALAVAPAHPVISNELQAGRKAAQTYFSSWPAGLEPENVGWRLITDFLSREIPSDRQLTCDEALSWMSSVMLARQQQNKALTETLLRKHDYLVAPPKPLVPCKGTQTERLMSGALDSELYLLTRQWRLQLNGRRAADTLWGKSTPEGLPAKAEITAEELFLYGFPQLQAYRATAEPPFLNRNITLAKACLKRLQQESGLLHSNASSPVFRSQGNGYAALGLAELLATLPEDHADKPALLSGYRKMMSALLKHQSSAGIWAALLDKTSEPADPAASGMITAAMAIGVRHGWLEGSIYGPATRKAWLALAASADVKGELSGHAAMIWAAHELLRK